MKKIDRINQRDEEFNYGFADQLVFVIGVIIVSPFLVLYFLFNWVCKKIKL